MAGEIDQDNTPIIQPGPPGVPELKTLPLEPTVEDIIASVKDYDARLASFLSQTVEGSFTESIGPYAGALSPPLLARWLDDVRRHDPEKIVRFVIEQQILYAMNPTVARVFNPTYLLLMLIPGSMGHIHTAADTQAGFNMKTVVEANELKLTVRAPFSDIPGRDQNAYGDGAEASIVQDFTVDSMVDIALIHGQTSAVPLSLVDSNNEKLMRYDSSKYFEGASRTRPDIVNRNKLRRSSITDSALAKSAAIDGIIRVPIKGEVRDQKYDGSVRSNTHDPSGIDGIDDDDARVPLSFTDLRHLLDKRFRSVYFQPLNLHISEHLAPEFNESTAFGRTDPVVGYVRTTRTFNVSFEVHVFAPEDLTIAYQKVQHLKSMVYPSYGADGLMRSGPVVKMRVGDLVRSDSGGIPGVIKTLTFDHGDALWELKRGLKVPRSISITLDFLALHEGPVGLLDDKFGVLSLPVGGFVGKPTNQSESREANDKVAQVLDSKFMRMPRS